MRMKNVLPFMLLFFLVGACNKDEIMLFDRGEAGVYFQSGNRTANFVNSELYVDSTDYSFYTESDTVVEIILTTKIRTMGKVRDYPRPVKLVIDTENTTAIEGVHYEMNPEDAVIPAGESSVSFPVRFFRTSDLGDRNIKLMFKLEDNEYFKVYFNEQKNTNVYYATGEQIMADRYKFLISEIYTRPLYWYSAEDYFGPWSVAKFRLVNDVCDIPVEDWLRGGYSDSKVRAGCFPIYAYMVRNVLQELADMKTPKLDDDGTYMQLGPNFKVDYSGCIE